MAKGKTLWLWLIALLLTIVVAVYQRLSGPTYPVRDSETLASAQIVYKFYRSWTTGGELPVRVTISNRFPAGNESAQLYFRRFPLIQGETWSIKPMEKKGDIFTAAIPTQAPAGKVVYKVRVLCGAKDLWLNHGQPVVARFKGDVPTSILLIHIIFMFAGLLLAFRTGLEALRRDDRREKLLAWTLAVTCCGGLVLGPLVQKFAFGAYWTGFPLGSDLTDSKTLFAVLVWLAAFLLRKKSSRWTLAATVLMAVVYLLPHSMLGSELNYKTGKVETAKEVRGSTFEVRR